jgi:hypothetical protein
VKAQAFVMRTPEGAVLQTPPGHWITLTITGATEKTITAKIEPGANLIDTASGSQVPVSGTFTAAFP